MSIFLLLIGLLCWIGSGFLGVWLGNRALDSMYPGCRGPLTLAQWTWVAGPLNIVIVLMLFQEACFGRSNR